MLTTPGAAVIFIGPFHMAGPTIRICSSNTIGRSRFTLTFGFESGKRLSPNNPDHATTRFPCGVNVRPGAPWCSSPPNNSTRPWSQFWPLSEERIVRIRLSRPQVHQARYNSSVCGLTVSPGLQSDALRNLELFSP